MNIVVLGATGVTGRLLVAKALETGHSVVAVARSAGADLGMAHARLRVVAADVTESGSLVTAFKGQDAVISVLGAKKGSNQLIERSTRALVAAATATDAKRVVVMSSFLVADNFQPGLIGRLINLFMKDMLQDKRAGERLLIKSPLDWTIVKPTTLDKAPAKSPVRVVAANESVSTRNAIARADVADFLLAELGPAAHHRMSVTITAK